MFVGHKFCIVNAIYHIGNNCQDRRIASPSYHYSGRENHPAVLAKVQTSYDDDGTTSTTRTKTLSRMNAPAASSYSS